MGEVVIGYRLVKIAVIRSLSKIVNIVILNVNSPEKLAILDGCDDVQIGKKLVLFGSLVLKP